MVRSKVVKKRSSKNDESSVKDLQTVNIMAEYDSITFLKVKDIFPSPTNPRKNFDEKELQELADSLKYAGMINPITVRKSKSKYELVSGERRWRAAQLAGMQQVPVIIRDLSDDEVLEVQIIENLQRKDVKPMDEARSYQALLKTKKYDVPGIAQKIGMQEDYVYRRLKLMDLIPQIQKAIEDGKLMFGHALLLCRLTPELQRVAYKDNVENWGRMIMVKELESYIKRELLLSLHSAPFKKDDEDLIPDIGACTNCIKRTLNNPLFSDFDVKDCCSDRVCFGVKMAAHITRRIKTEGLKKISSDDYSCSDKSAYLKYCDWHNNKKAYKTFTKKDICESAVKGIYIDGPQRGVVIDICIDQNCKKHWGKKKSSSLAGSSFNSRPKQTPDERYWRRLELIQQPEKVAVIRFTGTRILNEETNIPMEVILRKTVRRFFSKLDGAQKEMIVGMLGINSVPEDMKLSKLDTSTDELKAIYKQEFPEIWYGGIDKKELVFCAATDYRSTDSLLKLLFLMAHISRINPNNLEGILKDGDVINFLKDAGEYTDMKFIESQMAIDYQEKKDKLLKSFIKNNKRDPEPLKKEKDKIIEYDDDDFDIDEEKEEDEFKPNGIPLVERDDIDLGDD